MAEIVSKPDDSKTPDQVALPELLRIMDVATAIRRERDFVDRELNLADTKLRLRDQLLATAKVTGEPLQPADADRAIEEYFDRLHRFTEPRGGLQIFLARAYIRRRVIALWLVAVLAVSLLCGWPLWYFSGRLSSLWS